MIDVRIEGQIPVMWDQVFESGFERAARFMEVSIKRNFSEGGRPTTWKTLAKGGPSHLYLSGALFNTIGFEFGPNFAEAGAMSILPYTFIHQFGGFSGPGHSTFTPKREYIMFQPQDDEYIVELLIQSIDQAGRK